MGHHCKFSDIIYRLSRPEKQKQLCCPFLDEGGSKNHWSSGWHLDLGVLVAHPSFVSVDAFSSGQRHLSRMAGRGGGLCGLRADLMFLCPSDGPQGSVVS